MGGYSNLNIFITGANRGLGYGFVRHLLKHPVKNVFAGTRTLEKAKDLQAIAKDDQRLKIVKIDVTNDRSIQDAVEETSEITGSQGLNILINNSGVFSDKSSPENPSREKILETLNVNSVGPVITTAKFLPLLRQASSVEHPSKCVNLSSIAGSIEHIPEQHFWMRNASYAMSKAAVNAFTKYIAFSHFDSNLIFVALHPGWVRTHDDAAELSVDDSVESMLTTISKLRRKHSGSFLDHNGQFLPN